MRKPVVMVLQLPAANAGVAAAAKESAKAQMTAARNAVNASMGVLRVRCSTQVYFCSRLAVPWSTLKGLI
jgi:hypothetical protein